MKQMITTGTILLLLVLFSGCSEESDEKPAADPTRLETPAPQLFSGSVAEDSFIATWQSVENAVAYIYALNGEERGTTSETFIRLTGLAAETSYTLQVKAVPAEGGAYVESEWGELSITTLGNTSEPVPDPEPGPEPDPEPDPHPNPGTGPEIEGYRLIWSDEFDDDALDLKKWTIEENGNGGGNNELQYYDAHGVSMGTEPETGRKCLILTARKESWRGKSASSGRINTSGSFAFTHGRIDALIRLPHTANGLWPAFWLLGADYAQVGWPACGEIDILEMGHANGIRRGVQDRFMNGACHWGHYEGGGYPNYARHSEAPYSVQDGFHLFTLVWDEQAVKCYLDMNLHPETEPYFAMNIDDRSNDSSPGNYFHHDFFIIFNLAVGGNFPGIWDIDQITALDNGEAQMYVDYVRVYSAE